MSAEDFQRTVRNNSKLSQWNIYSNLIAYRVLQDHEERMAFNYTRDAGQVPTGFECSMRLGAVEKLY